MKTVRIMLALCVLATTAGKAQFNGQSLYNHSGLNALLTSGTYVNNSAGFIMAGHLPVVSGTMPNFVIDKVGPDGTFLPAGSFSQQYSLFTGGFPCISITGQEMNCYGVSVIESFGGTSSNVRYALAASFDTGILFATLNAGGGVVNSAYYLLGNGWVPNGKPLLVRASNGDHFVVGNFTAGNQDFIYAFQILATGGAGWSQLYFLNAGIMYQAHAIVCDNYIGSPEIAVVGTLGTTTTDGFFMTIDGTTGGLLIEEALASGFTVNESLSSIALATSNNGYIVGGSTDMNFSTNTAWMMNLNSNGTINWSTRIDALTNANAGEVVGVTERWSSFYSDYEYYGVTISSGASGGMLVFKLNGSGNAFSQGTNIYNEFLYNDGSGNIAFPAAISNIDQGIGGTNTGIHVFGTDQANPGQFFLTQAFYNGASANCNINTAQTLTTMVQAVQGPTVIYTYTATPHSGLTRCKQHQLRNIPLNYAPNQPCYMNGTPGAPYGGDNNRVMATTGIEKTDRSNSTLSIYPNPISDVMEISYTNGKAGHVEITISDILGREMRTLESGYKEEGTNTFKFDLGSLGLNNGVYFINVNADGAKSQQKIIYGKN